MTRSEEEYLAIIRMAEILAKRCADAERALDDARYNYAEMVSQLRQRLQTDSGTFASILRAINELRAIRAQLVEQTYREGFQAGRDHGNLSYKYPPEDIAWTYSEAREALTGEKQTEAMPGWPGSR